MNHARTAGAQPMKPNDKARGNCYEVAFMTLLQMSKTRDAVLVHGIPMGQGKIAGVRYGHAWVETGLLVIDPVHGEIPKGEYYAIGRIKHAVRYTLAEAMELAEKIKTYGPWDATVSAALHKKRNKGGNRMKYFVLAFNDRTVVRTTHAKHPDVKSALKEQYGSITECFYAEVDTKSGILPVAKGEKDAEWWEIYRNDDGKLQKRKANFSRINPKVVQ